MTFSPSTAAAVAETLRKTGAVVLLPTETLYGLVCRAGDETACRKIFSLKGRAVDKKVGWFAADRSMLEAHGVIIDGLPARLIERYTPGALTIIAPVKDGSTRGFRIPDHPLLLEIMRILNEPLIQTSANASGMPDVRSVKEALAQLHGKVDLAIDGGILPEGRLGSTVVDATGKTVKILRQGELMIPEDEGINL